jgi:protein ImuB
MVASAFKSSSGVRIGMRRGGVLSISPDTTLHDRHTAQEKEALNSIAITLLQYTPEVAFAEEESVLLDVTASLSAFNGRLALSRRIRSSICTLGFTPQVGMAPTAQGAWLLARYRTNRSLPKQRRVIQMESMTRRLDALPCTLLPATAPYQDWRGGPVCLDSNLALLSGALRT